MGTPLFFLGIRVGRCCGILIITLYLIPGKNAWLCHMTQTLAQLINLGMENWFILGKKDPTTISFIFCTSPRNGTPSSRVAPQTPKLLLA